MKIYKETSMDNFNAWGAAVETLATIKDEGKIELLEQLLEEYYPEGASETEINDILSFEDEWVYEMLDIDYYEEVDPDEFYGMHACDLTGFCSGAACPRFFECKG